MNLELGEQAKDFAVVDLSTQKNGVNISERFACGNTPVANSVPQAESDASAS